MLSILDRYFLRELAYGVIATAVVLLVIFAGGAFATVLQKVANGSIQPSVMFEVLGLQMVDLLSTLLPMAAFLGTLIALGRMYRESEMHVLASSGMGPRGMLRPVIMLTVVATLVVGTVSLWLGPWSARKADQVIAVANKSVIAAGLDAGRFTELPGKGGIIFVDALSRDGTVLGKTFLASDHVDSQGRTSVRVVNAKSGRMYQEADGQNRFLALYDGWQYEIPLGTDNWRRMKYERNDASLSSIADDDDEDPAHELTTPALFKATDADALGELVSRFAAPVSTLVLMMMVLPMSRQAPRDARYGRLLVAVLAYFLYVIWQLIARAQIIKERLHTPIPIWVLHIIVFAIAAWVFWRQNSPRRAKEATR
ncbi:LPS export ABC transporter permease LptF [Luteibacter anthropi]|uniref:Lipopolysaccharide export system permease protein LptF n=1 Tax=Luteibacter anthropi TaxID=564369 RepID=A0A7X5UAA0_9GAMM|nr:LPS export ABC transporter permease LptF [Luteibacter anthropi]NII06647.1 LPS export ABC transporter permease LptF [Luteibacter anthropi]URX60848.1 LPS export ABC transporter permease LptF [Luteibacter anthropi]